MDMTGRRIGVRLAVLLVGATLLVGFIAVPALAEQPAGGPPGQSKEHAPKVSVTLEGTVEVTADADGNDSYTLRSGGTTYELDAGPAWFHGNDHPLAAFVGQSVTIAGEQAEGSSSIDVLAVNGQQIRAAGKPSWAGGWKVVGKKHPGWSQEKAQRFAEKFGDCFPPGQCKEKPQGSGGETAE